MRSDLRTGSNTWLSHSCNLWDTVSLSSGAIMRYLTSLSFLIYHMRITTAPTLMGSWEY